MVKLLVGHKGSGKTKQMIDLATVSYTHLDVYKRQAKGRVEKVEDVMNIGDKVEVKVEMCIRDSCGSMRRNQRHESSGHRR